MAGDEAEDAVLLREMYEEARDFLNHFDWCEAIEHAYISEIAIGGVVAVFYFKIVPKSRGVDDSLWVVVGDLPPAYLVTDQARTGSDALRVYIAEMRGWVEAVRAGGNLEGIIPVNAPPNSEHADMLASRLEYLENEVLPRQRNSNGQ